MLSRTEINIMDALCIPVLLRQELSLNREQPLQSTDIISSRSSDFEIDGKTFEVGGRKKGKDR